MKSIGFILIIAGILMMVFRGFSVTTEKEVADIGPLEINKKENKWIGWPTYAGGALVVVGIVMVVTGKRKTA
ncbi:hypothetical protein [Pollutibacter soli]|jgi:hypothetical protein|uniref:hypothetical protein n=1 Tax=Pollutibacter soli TaxID=3034157 RepID=UPI003013B5D0